MAVEIDIPGSFFQWSESSAAERRESDTESKLHPLQLQVRLASSDRGGYRGDVQKRSIYGKKGPAKEEDSSSDSSSEESSAEEQEGEEEGGDEM